MSLFTTNSYLQVSDAEDYFMSRLNSDSWDDATSEDKNKSLITATKIIDRLNFEGTKTSDYNFFVLKQAPVEQPLEFPRNGKSIVPEDILVACCEIAFAILDGIDLTAETDLLGAQSLRFADVSTSYMTGFAPEHIRAGVPSLEAWLRLKPYLHDPMQVTTKRA